MTVSQVSSYHLVEEYSSLGIHRTGTPVDNETVDWFAAHLEALGLEVSREPYEFDRWTADSTLTIDGGTEIDHLPVFHEFEGSVDTDRVHLEVIDPIFGGYPDVLDAPISAAKYAGAEALAVITIHPDETVVAINQHPTEGSGFPVVLVPSAAAQALGDAATRGAIRLQIDAATAPATSNNVLATNGLDGPGIFITTPLTGWFTCAGERGTGIAVTIDLAERLTSAGVPIRVLATTGHELDYLGARRWLDANQVTEPATLHVGASIGVLDGHRVALTNVAATDAADIAAAVEAMDIVLSTDARGWLGEGELHAGAGNRLLSFSGAGNDFHTPNDTPERATSPAFMQQVCHAAFDAATALHQLATTSPPRS